MNVINYYFDDNHQEFILLEYYIMNSCNHHHAYFRNLYACLFGVLSSNAIKNVTLTMSGTFGGDFNLAVWWF